MALPVVLRFIQRTFPQILLPVTIAIGFIGYSIETYIRPPKPISEMPASRSIQEQRQERQLNENSSCHKMADNNPNYVIKNCLITAFHSLRGLGRFVEGSHVSPYKEFFDKVMNRKVDEVGNSEVESYYLNKMTEEEFVSTGEGRLLSGIVGDPDLTERLLSVVWDTQLATAVYANMCGSNLRQAGRQLWEMFIHLDLESQLAVHIEDVCDLILRIFKSNGHVEQPVVIQQWFSNLETVQFWPFFKVMTKDYKQFLQTPVVNELYKMISTETIKEGKLSKKGHIMPNWKGRWFTLTFSNLTYREAQDAPVIKMITINDKTQVQNMPDTRGHLFRFRVLDGSSSTPTEMSATDDFTMREWMAFIKLAVKMHQVEGRNFLHRYRLAINTFPKSFFSQATAVPAFTAAPVLPQAKKSNTDPSNSSHRALKASHSVPLGEGKNDNKKRPLPPIHQEGEDQPDAGELNGPPPLPPQRFNADSLERHTEPPRNRKCGTPERDYPMNSYRGQVRRRSSLDSSEIEHIQVDGDLEYAVVTKVVKKKKPKTSSPDLYAEQQQQGRSQEQSVLKTSSPALNKKACSVDSPPLPPAHTSTPSQPNPPPRRSPKMPKKTVSLDGPPVPPSRNAHPTIAPVPPTRPSHLTGAPVPPSRRPRSPHSSPTPPRKGYAELQFENGALSNAPDAPNDVPTKFGYSQLQFEREQTNGDSETKAQNKPLPPPKYQGNMAKSITESNLHSSSNGQPPRSKPVSLPDIGGKAKRHEPNLDYAEVVFSKNPAVSPSVTRRILVPSPEDTHKNVLASSPRVEYATIMLANQPTETTKMETKKAPAKDSGYENFDFTPVKSKPPRNDGYEDCFLNGPKVAGSARLVKPDQLKPRASPRKVAPNPSVNNEIPPAPPARKTSGNTT